MFNMQVRANVVTLQVRELIKAAETPPKKVEQLEAMLTELEGVLEALPEGGKQR